MVIESDLFKQTIKKKGYWNYSDLYTFCFEWFKREGYDVKEKEYTEKNSDFGKEIMLEWMATKEVTDYYKFGIKVKWQILGMNSAEVERDGRKEKTNKGDLKIDVAVTLVKDYEQNWEKSPFLKFMRGLYDNYINRTTNDVYEDRLESKALSFIRDVKAFLDLNT
jgi:hypothetical protein